MYKISDQKYFFILDQIKNDNPWETFTEDELDDLVEQYLKDEYENSYHGHPSLTVEERNS
tara:strand:+ start:321 stop:500 length:180 start_codon:yes stop_codon:yes gene_type:complete